MIYIIISLVIILIVQKLVFDAKNGELRQLLNEEKAKSHTLQLRLNVIDNELELLRVQFNTKNVNLDTIKVGDKFQVGDMSDLRVLVELPENKFQLLVLNKNGSVLGANNMGVVNSLEEVRQYIKNSSKIYRLVE